MPQLHELVEDAWNEQILKNEANHIFTKVDAARKSTTEAGGRWPFEMLQNAHDAGPRSGQKGIGVDITWEQGKDGWVLGVRHDGAPFKPTDLTALLSGGSGKERESENTTGRFGTGFLVTHVLSSSAHIRGVAAHDGELSLFEVLLERGGNEQDILENIKACREAVKSARPISTLEEVPFTAEFRYSLQGAEPMWLGINALRSALPYLFGTCEKLERVSVRLRDGAVEEWRAEAPTEETRDRGRLSDRRVSVSSGASVTRLLRVLHYTAALDYSASVLVVIESDLGNAEGPWRVLRPAKGFPRVFRRFPLRGMGWVPIDVVLDGPFPVDQERHHIHWEASKLLVREALDALPFAVQHAHESDFVGVHRCAAVWPPVKDAGVADAEHLWWQKELSQTAHALASLGVIPTTNGTLPAVPDADDPLYADFPVPQVRLSSESDEVSFERMWKLLEATTYYCPPQLSVAPDWTEVARGWHGLDVDTELVTLSSLIKTVRGDAKRLDDIDKVPDPLPWLAEVLDVVGEAWQGRGEINPEILKGILPNQLGQLCSPGELDRDADIPDDLKDIARRIGINVRAQLISRELSVKAGSNLQFLASTIENITRRARTEAMLVDECVRGIEEKLPSGTKAGTADAGIASASRAFLAWLWNRRGANGSALARRIPLIARDGSVQRFTPNRRMMPPVIRWPETARPFYRAWTPAWILDEAYGEAVAGSAPLMDALVAWEMAYSGILISVSIPEIKDRRLSALAPESASVEGAIVRQQAFKQVPLLGVDIIPRCSSVDDGVEAATALLGLVLCHLARSDHEWKTWKEYPAKKGGADTKISLRPSVWLADLKYLPWVPVQTTGEQYRPDYATELTLRPYLDHAWLSGNEDGVRFLEECFGFDGLDLRLLGTTSDATERQKMRDQLAAIVDATSGSDSHATLTALTDIAALVQATGTNTSELEAIRTELQQRQHRDNQAQRWRKYGLAIQGAVQQALEDCDLDIDVIDCGYDFAVYVGSGAEPEAIAQFEVGSYFMEVKATTANEVRMTHTQARKAAETPATYVLCVVQLPESATTDLEAEELVAKVAQTARILVDIGNRVGVTYRHVRDAVDGDVGIRNETALRYAVNEAAWSAGVTIATWVESIRVDSSKPETAPAEASADAT